MADSRKRYIGGAAVQVAITLSLATQAFFGPRILGSLDYGRMIAALSLPILAQASIETVLYALTIKWTSGRRLEVLKRLWLDALWMAPVAGLLAALLSTSSLAADDSSRWIFIAGAPFLLLLWIATTTLMGAAYALHRHTALARAYFISSLVLPAGVYLFRHAGAPAFLYALLFDKLAQIASLAVDKETRRFSREVLHAAVARRSSKRFFDEYFPVLTPRLTVLLLSPGLVAACSWLLLPPELAGFKVSLSFVTAAASMVPISQYVLQAHWTDRAAMDREAKLIFGGVALAGVVFGVLLWFLGDLLRGFVLRTDDPALHKFNVVFLAVPLFVLIGPISSLLIARDQTRALVYCFLGSLLATGAATAAAGPSWGFVAGTTAFVLMAAASARRPASR